MASVVKTTTPTKEFLIEQLKKSFGHHMDLKEIKPNTFQLFLPYYHMDGDMLDIFMEICGENKLIVKDF
ncbi:MAG: hypothetical protein LBD75_07890 [Candidatus Peribacteria bacterium]|nr:hypothetical protein [Candidatus Peribacteria bacterium]